MKSSIPRVYLRHIANAQNEFRRKRIKGLKMNKFTTIAYKEIEHVFVCRKAYIS